MISRADPRKKNSGSRNEEGSLLTMLVSNINDVYNWKSAFQFSSDLPTILPVSIAAPYPMLGPRIGLVETRYH